MTFRNILLHFEFSNKTLWSETRYAVDNFDLAFLCWDEKNSLFHISHNTPCLRPSSPTPPPKQKCCITFVFNFFWVLQLSLEKLKTTLMQNFGGKQGELYLRRCGIGDHPLCPRVFSFSNIAVTGRTEKPYYYICRPVKREELFLAKLLPAENGIKARVSVWFTFQVFVSNLSCNNNQTFSLTAFCNLFIMCKLYTATKRLTVVSHKWKRYYLLSLFG